MCIAHFSSRCNCIEYGIFTPIWYESGMEFEFDPEKSARNRVKHNIDFEEAQVLWQDEWLLEVPARTVDEPRFLAIGKMAGKHWTAVFARRGNRIRIISVRRSREQEIRHYEGMS